MYNEQYLDEYKQDLDQFKVETETIQKSFHKLAYIAWKCNRSPEHPLHLFSNELCTALTDIGQSIDSFAALNFVIIPRLVNQYETGEWFNMSMKDRICWFSTASNIAESRITRTGALLSSLKPI
jgi:hypothetical protein